MATSRQDLLAKYVTRLHCQPQKLQPYLADLIPESLVKRVREEFYNPLVLEMATCVLFSIFAATTSNVPINERIRYWFRDLEQIGAESVEGYAMRADLGLVEDTLILKAPRDPNSDLLHELFIGLYGTNRLRAILPNFAYLFGGFNCSVPIIQPRFEVVAGKAIKRDKAEVVSYCESGPKDVVPYIIYENIAPAVSMANYVETCTGEEFFLIFSQILYALRKAWLSFGFVHNDLHHENVLIRQLAEVFSFPYSTHQGIRFITTDQLGTIIDFGRSHIIYQGRHYGFTGLESVGVFEDIPLPITDVYKLLFFSLFTMLQAKNWKAFHQVKRLVPYFHPELTLDDPNFDRILLRLLDKGRSDVFYYLKLSRQEQEKFRRFIKEYKNPQSTEFLQSNVPKRWFIAASFDFDDFLLYLSRHCQCSFLTQQPLARLAYCQKDACGRSEEILNSFFEHPFNQPPTPEDFFEFYDLHTNRKANLRFKEDLITNFSNIYPQAKEDYLANLLGEINNFIEIITEIDPNLTLVNLSPEAINGLVNIYRERFTRLAEATSNWKRIPFMVEVGQYVARLYKDESLLVKIGELVAQGRPYQLRLAGYLEGLIADLNYWLPFLNNNITIAQANRSPNLNWLRLVFPQALNVLLE